MTDTFLRQPPKTGHALATDNTLLQPDNNYGKINTKRRVQIFSQMVRHLTALVYLVAELYLGEKPEKL